MRREDDGFAGEESFKDAAVAVPGFFSEFERSFFGGKIGRDHPDL